MDQKWHVYIHEFNTFSDVVRNHEIPFFECTTMFRTVVDKADLNNCFVIQARLFTFGYGVDTI